jgi:flagellar biosynthesis protein FlhG
MMLDSMTLKSEIAMSDHVKVLAVASGKGGVGKTNLSTNLAVALAKLGQQVVLLDADLGLANVDILLGLQPEHDLKDVVSGEKTLEEIMLEGPAGLRIIPASSGVEHMASFSELECAGLINAFSAMESELDVLLVDAAAGIAGDVLTFTRAAQEILVVVCDEPTSITDAYALMKVLSTQYNVRKFHVVASMVNDEAHGLAVYEKLLDVTDRFLEIGLRYLGAVPFDEQLRKAVRAQETVVTRYPRAPSSKSFSKMAEKVMGWDSAGGVSGQLQFFLERILSSATSTDRLTGS